MRPKFNIFYTVKKMHGDGVSNQRIFFVSKYKGQPFLSLPIGPTSWQEQQGRAALHLGLNVEDCIFHSHRGQKMKSGSHG
jgi:hypothetical protein